MIKSRTSILIFIFLLPMFSMMGQKGQDPEQVPWTQITNSIREGNASALSAYFSSMVDLGLPEKDNSYSKSQGEIVMKDFFKNYPPDAFDVLQKGQTSETNHYAICQYKTEGKKYQVSIYLRKEEGAFQISKIKFEKQEP